MDGQQPCLAKALFFLLTLCADGGAQRASGGGRRGAAGAPGTRILPPTPTCLPRLPQTRCLNPHTPADSTLAPQTPPDSYYASPDSHEAQIAPIYSAAGREGGGVEGITSSPARLAVLRIVLRLAVLRVVLRGWQSRNVTQRTISHARLAVMLSHHSLTHSLSLAFSRRSLHASPQLGRCRANPVAAEQSFVAGSNAVAKRFTEDVHPRPCR